jgi:hypothetical protein
MTRLGFLPRYFFVAVIGCNAVLLSSAQNIPVSDLDKMVNRVPPPTPDGPVWGHAQGKVKEISKKTITIVGPGGQELTFHLAHAVRTEQTLPGNQWKEIRLADIASGDSVLVRFKKNDNPHKALGILVER